MTRRATWIMAWMLALVGSAGVAAAHPASARGFSMRLEDEHGRALPTFHHRGDTYVLGAFGERYNVRIFNHTGRRAEAVVTVDGRDVLTGDVGDYARQRGYIVPPHGSVLIEGFRRSLSDVAAFRFTDPGDSYSARRGTPQHVGVVGVAIFRERWSPPPQAVAPPPRSHDWDDRSSAGAGEARKGRAAPRAQAEAEPSAPLGDYGAAPGRPRSRNNLGTRYGERRFSPVTEVPFRRANAHRPDVVLAVYYDDAEGLAARGIYVHPSWHAEPRPFPDSDRRFAPPPPRW